MKLNTLRYIIITGLLIMSGNLYSQFGGNNLFEVQLGNVPGSEPAALLSNYNQLNLHYRDKGFKASGRFEYFINEFSDRRYISPTQLQLQYKSKSFVFKVGNYYDMLGTGLLLRAYDRRDLIKDISTVLSTADTPVTDISSRLDETLDEVTIRLKVRVKDYEQLSELLNRVGSVTNVIEATRMRHRS